LDWIDLRLGLVEVNWVDLAC